MKRISILLLLLLATLCCRSQTQHAWSAAEKQVFEQLNHARIANGLPELEWSDQAARAARLHTQALVRNRSLSHQFAGESPLLERVGATGVRFTVAAENVARTDHMEDVHLALINSAGHRANMLSTRYNAVGIGVIEDHGKIYATQDFIFSIPTYSEEQFDSAFAQAFGMARKSKSSRPLELQSNTSLHELACNTDGSVAKLVNKVSGAREVVVFSSSEPHTVPEELLKRAASANFHRMNFGACFRPDDQHGYANFWVVATFSN
jgi:hypothetical protein